MKSQVSSRVREMLADELGKPWDRNFYDTQEHIVERLAGMKPAELLDLIGQAVEDIYGPKFDTDD